LILNYCLFLFFSLFVFIKFNSLIFNFLLSLGNFFIGNLCFGFDFLFLLRLDNILSFFHLFNFNFFFLWLLFSFLFS